MTVQEIMTTLESFGSPNIKKILLKHGVKEPLFGVKVEQLKTIQKLVKKDYELAKGLYATHNADAMYLAGLIADDEKMTVEDLDLWVKEAVSNNISEYTVPWVAAEGKYGWELALKWIKSEEEHIAASGWATLGGLVSLKPDNTLDIPKIKELMYGIANQIHQERNRVKYTMNGFLIAVGAYIKELTEEALALSEKIGVVTVDMAGTACNVPNAKEYIQKTINAKSPYKKKKTVKC